MASKYHKVGDDEKFEEVFPGRSSTSESLGSTLLEDEEDSQHIAPRKQSGGHWMWLVHAVLLTLSFAMFSFSYYTQISTLRHVQQFSAYSPAAKAVEYQKVKFNNTMGEGSPYVGASDEVDRAWRALSYDIGDQMITPDELDIIGMPKSSLKVKHPKTGVEGYRVGLEVFHQLHCINLLRRATFKDYYVELGTDGDFAEGDDMLRIHLDHCLEILRLNTQCNADIGVFTFYLLEDDPLPWPELHSYHQCRNFDRVRDWALEHSVGNMERGDVATPPMELSN